MKKILMNIISSPLTSLLQKYENNNNFSLLVSHFRSIQGRQNPSGLYSKLKPCNFYQETLKYDQPMTTHPPPFSITQNTSFHKFSLYF